jgi:hypothetical protein
MRLQVGAVSYEVREVPNLQDDDGADLFGDCNMITKTIRVRSNVSAKLRAMALLHEFLHAVTYEFGSDLTETQTMVVEQGVAMLYAQAPDLFRRLK